MLLKVTELNHWEKEKWSYLIDLDKQEATAVNDLFSFFRLAREQFDKDKSQAGCRGQSHFASSNYYYEFYDSLDTRGNYPVLKRKDCNLCMNGGGGYKSNMLSLKNIISVRKIRSARNAMRDKKENKLYKNFEYIFLK